MPLFPNIKPRLKQQLKPFVQRLASAGATPNQVMWVNFILCATGGGAVLLGSFSPHFLLAIPVVLLLRTMLNATDGMLTREYQHQTRWGATITELGDIFSDVLLYLPFALIPGIQAWLMVVLVILIIIAEFSTLIAHIVRVAKQYDGPMGKSDRTAIFFLLSLIIGCGVPPGLWTSIVLGVTAILLIIAMYWHLSQALIKARRRFKR